MLAKTALSKEFIAFFKRGSKIFLNAPSERGFFKVDKHFIDRRI
jgi:tRNA nucleotidyltransferase (CCA-adding enzyme)